MSTRVKVAFVNEPKEGKEQGTIKTSDDQLFGVFKVNKHGKKNPTLDQFVAGQSYDIEFESRQWNGKTLTTVTKAIPVSDAPTNGNRATSSHPGGERGLRIERMHAQNAALAFAALNPDVRYAFENIQALTDRFQLDIENTPESLDQEEGAPF